MRRPYDEARPDASPIDHLWRTSGLGLLLSRRAARGALKGPRRGAPQEIRDCAALERIPKDIPLDKSHVVVNDVRTARFDFANRFCESILRIGASKSFCLLERRFGYLLSN